MIYTHKISICPFLIMVVILFALFQCSKTNQDISDPSGKIFIVYDSKACECIRKQGEFIIHKIDSIRTIDSSLDSHFTFRQIDRAKEKDAANDIIDRCNDQFIPVVLIEGPQEQSVFNFSFEFDPMLFLQIVKNLKEMKSSY